MHAHRPPLPRAIPAFPLPHQVFGEPHQSCMALYQSAPRTRSGLTPGRSGYSRAPKRRARVSTKPVAIRRHTSTSYSASGASARSYRPELLKISSCYDYYFFFVVFFAVFFFGGFFLPGPLCGMSLLLSLCYRFCVIPIRSIKFATRGSERSPSNAGTVFR